MSKDAALRKPQTRPIDPSVVQRQASDPLSSIGVSASAGSGKTKVLTDRVLRLLLPREDGQPGTKPHKILCITYTKAAAAEMQSRIAEFMANWTIFSDEDLINHKKYGLKELLGRAPSDAEIDAARKLFAETMDAPGGLQVMTIHAFCQSVLGRFPLEAKISPQFEVLEDSRPVFAAAIGRALAKANRETASPLQAAANRLAAALDPDRLANILNTIARERRQVEAIAAWGPEGLYTRLCAKLDTPPNLTPEDIIREACGNDALIPDLKNTAAIMEAAKSSEEAGFGQKIQDWLGSTAEVRSKNFAAYMCVYVTDNGPRSRSFPSKDTAAKNPDVVSILAAETQRLLAVMESANKAACAQLTADLFTLGKTVIAEYTALKTAKGVLDFDDLILRTLDLLQGKLDSGKSFAPWVMYKLDEGIDHILLDEAQDTSPEQWDIIAALSDEFFAGKGACEQTRTVFTVGDLKQSIYGFNRADPARFAAMQEALRKKAEEAGQEWETVPMDTSFRSAPAILQTIDSVFADHWQGLGDKPPAHGTVRLGQEGVVELWPLAPYLTPRQKNKDEEFWQPPIEITEKPDGQNALAKAIAAKIKSWIGKEQLPTRGRAVQPGDILILLRTRTAFFSKLVRALKEQKIPVSGVDRMVLDEEIAVQDLLAAANFALLPEDDLTLACLLKSPLLGWSEDELMNLAAYRPQNTPLWSSLQQNGRDVEYLRELINKARNSRPYEFFNSILQQSCPADSKSGLRAMKSRLGEDVQDPLDELLAAALSYEHENIPSLQGFLHWQHHSGSEIKRELEESHGKLRIMTVHGAKGLQAPIVILPDTMLPSANSRGSDRLLWPEKNDLGIPLYSPRTHTDFPAYIQAMNAYKTAQDEEYRRLLYVAMTRAEDRLYVCGCAAKDEAPEGSWYALVQDGLKSLGAEERPDGTLFFQNPQVKDPDRQTKQAAKDKTATAPPAWLYEKAAPEKFETSLRPSGEPVINSPMDKNAEQRFRRGNLTHKLLQFLPALPPEKRKAAGLSFLQQFAGDLKDTHENILSEILNILQNPAYAGFFAENSFAEIPVSGRLSKGIINGQIDRLSITATDIWILDYKTNRTPPAKAPPAYINQMRDYRDVLSSAYPGRKIHCALLWTDGPVLMKLDI